MPLLTAVLTVSQVLRRLIGENGIAEEKREERNASSQRYIKAYNEEFIRFFPTVLSILVGRKTSVPRLTTAYDHLEKVRFLVQPAWPRSRCYFSFQFVIRILYFMFLQSLNYNAVGGQ